MTTRPSVDQARAYADALVAWAEGKRVEFRCARTNSLWTPLRDQVAFPHMEYEYEYRIAPAPPKLRDVWILSSCVIYGCAHDVSYTEPNRRDTWVHFREVSETADAELAELRRYRTEMRKVLDRWYSSNNPTSQSLYSMLCEKEIHG